MLQAGREPDLSRKALRAERGRKLRLQHLQSNSPVVPRVMGDEDHSHAPVADLALDLVTPSKGQPERLRNGVHRLGNIMSKLSGAWLKAWD